MAGAAGLPAPRVDRQRKAASLETSPLTRLLAEVVLRPPDVRHLDAAFQAIAAAPREQSALKVWLGEKYASRCATCGRSVVLDEIIWETVAGEARDPSTSTTAAPSVATRSAARPAPRRDRRGRPRPDRRDRPARPGLAGRSVTGSRPWTATTPSSRSCSTSIRPASCSACRRSSSGSRATCARRRSRRRCGSPSSTRCSRHRGSTATPDASPTSGSAAAGSACRPAASGASAIRGSPSRTASALVRGFVQRLEGAPLGLMTARFGEDLQSLSEGMANVVVRLGTPSSFRSLGAEADALSRLPDRPRVRLVLGQPPHARTSRAAVVRLLRDRLGPRPRGGVAAAPGGGLRCRAGRAPWGWQSAAIRRGIRGRGAADQPRRRASCSSSSAGGPEGLVAAALGGVAAGYRLVGARLAEPGEEIGGTVDFVPPGATVPVGPRTRANVDPAAMSRAAPATPRRCRATPLRAGRAVRPGPLSEADVARTVTDTAVEILQARGEPARYERLLGEILVGLDRAGQLRRLVSRPGARTTGPTSTRQATAWRPGRAPSADPMRVVRSVPSPSRRTGCRPGAGSRRHDGRRARGGGQPDVRAARRA